MNQNIINSLEQAGFSYAVAVATQAEIQAQAACGQLAMVVDDNNP
jgi:adenine C2-methylase RlmN of 23S rRNA A2503 and tRNA A37